MNQLPDELKLEMFSFLDKKSLLSAASTCKQLRYLILTYKPLMAYLDFVVTDFGMQKNFLVNYGIGLSTISLGTNAPDQWRLKGIKMNSTNLQLLIRSASRIEELKVNQFCPPTAAKKVVPNLDLPFLKKLTMNHNGNNSRMFNFLNESRPTEFTANFKKSHNMISYFSDTFWNWIKLQSNLTSLTLFDRAIVEFFKQIKIDELQIKFKKLSFNCYYLRYGLRGINEVYFDKLLEFLKTQDEVEEIVLDTFNMFSSHKGYNQVMHQILFEMKSLKILNLKENTFSFGDSQSTHVNLNLESLILSLNNNWDVLHCLKCFPNLKKLEIKYVNSSLATSIVGPNLKIISQIMNELESIKLTKLQLTNAIESINLRKLKIISLVDCSLETNDWQLLTQRTPLVEKLSLDLYKLLNDSARTFINWRNFKELELQCGTYQDGLINELAQCPALKRLKISESMRNQFADQLQNVDMKVEVFKISKVLKIAEYSNSYYVQDGNDNELLLDDDDDDQYYNNNRDFYATISLDLDSSDSSLFDFW